MKKSLLLSLMMLLGAATPMMAQSSTDDYVPLVVEGAKWECDYHINPWHSEPCDIPYTIEIKGDTIIDNITYKCCVYTFEGGVCEWSGYVVPAGTLTLAFIREDVENRKVYARSSDTQQHDVYSQFINFKESNGEFLLYDFANIDNPNQIWQKSYYPQGPLTITAEKITIDGVERNCYAIGQNGIYGHIVEGIGYDGKGYEQNSGDLMCQFPIFAAGTDNLPVFKAHKNASKQTIYQSGDAANVFNSVENIVTDLNAPTQYYNLQGVKVDKPQGGVFIKVQGDKATKMYIK